MTQDLWSQVDDYINDLYAPHDAALDATVQAAIDAGMPGTHITANQGKLLLILARLIGARRILEIGALAGYSTIWLARALPTDGRLLTLEYNPKHAEVVRANVARAGLAERVEVCLGDGLTTMQQWIDDGAEPFDMIFIDPDEKRRYPEFLELAMRLTHPGSLLVADNTIRHGKVLEQPSPDPNMRGVQQFNAALAADPRLDATIMQMVGLKGWDGIALAMVRK
jgi:predicted O-methyltransferase YrrM